MEISATGKAAESLVKADLEMEGYVVWITTESKTTIDLIAQDSEGHLVRVQVKSFTADGSSYDVDIRRPHAKKRHYSEHSYDVLAIVDVNSRNITYLNRKFLSEREVKRSVRVWRSSKREYSSKIKCKPPVFHEEHSSFKEAYTYQGVS